MELEQENFPGTEANQHIYLQFPSNMACDSRTEQILWLGHLAELFFWLNNDYWVDWVSQFAKDTGIP